VNAAFGPCPCLSGAQDLQQHCMAVPTPRDAPAVLAAYTRVPSRARPGSPATDQGRTAQNVPICVAYTASHDIGKAAQNGGSACGYHELRTLLVA